MHTTLLIPPFCAAVKWVVWREERRNGKRTKVPYDPRSGRRASVMDPTTWGTYDEAVAAAQSGYDGIGFVFTEDDGLTGLDLDRCRNPETGEIEAWALDIVRALDSYTEISPSGTGLHILVRAKLPPGRRRAGNIELYDAARYFTFTGHHLIGTPKTIEPRQAQVDALYRSLFPDETPATTLIRTSPPVQVDDVTLLERARNAANGAKFRRLWAGDWSDYPSRSEADLALCSILTFWTGGDAARIDRLFRQSGLYREKWEREDYRRRTMEKALAGGTKRFAPHDDNPRDTLRALRAHAVTRSWENPRTRETDRRCYLALIERALEVGTPEVAMSSRDLAERAGCGHMTASRALRRLVGYGLIELVEASNGFDAPVWRLNMLRSDTLTLNTVGGGGGEGKGRGDEGVEPPPVANGKCIISLHIDPATLSALANDDAFLWGSKLRPDLRGESEPAGCLGPTAASLIAALVARDGVRIGELTEATGVHRITVGRKVKVMAKLGLVRLAKMGRTVLVHLVEGWQEVLDRLRERLTTFGRGLKRKLEHTKQRAAYYARLLRRLPWRLRARAGAIAEALERVRERRPALEQALMRIRPEDGFWRRPTEHRQPEARQTVLPAHHRQRHWEVAQLWQDMVRLAETGGAGRGGH